MPVLLLCRGEVDAKDRLRNAIEARYGTNPPAIEKIRIGFEGRTRFNMGPVSAWVPVSAEASFVFPTHLRWDFTVKPFKLPVQKGIEVFDGKTYRTQRAIGRNTESGKTDIITSARGRLWQMAAILLTPMSDYYIEVLNSGENGIKAVNTKLNDSVNIYLCEDYTISRAIVQCFNPDTAKQQNLVLKLSREQAPVDGLMLPERIAAFWDNEPYFEMSPTEVEMHPDLSEEHFTLGAKTVTGGVGD